MHHALNERGEDIFDRGTLSPARADKFAHERSVCQLCCAEMSGRR